MLNQRPHSSNGEMRSQHGAWRAGQNLQGWIENRTPPIELQREIQRLGSLLEKERFIHQRARTRLIESLELTFRLRWSGLSIRGAQR
uniref:Uncharacterized protein n=1 Tax=Xiphophorus maculatus TaxID=8083 RepID=A0A3B5PZ85_XIPMA